VRAYYREAQGLLLVYDITKRSSFDNVKRWLTDVERHTAEHGQVINKVLIGNKADLSDRRAVTMSEGQALADNLVRRVLFERCLKGLKKKIWLLK